MPRSECNIPCNGFKQLEGKLKNQKTLTAKFAADADRLERENKKLKEENDFYKDFENFRISKETDVVCCEKAEQGKCYPLRKAIEKSNEIQEGWHAVRRNQK